MKESYYFLNNPAFVDGCGLTNSLFQFLTILSRVFCRFKHNGGAKRRHAPAGSAASSAGEMPTVLIDLLAPRESARKAIISRFYDRHRRR
jgi:hypothetical protein